MFQSLLDYNQGDLKYCHKLTQSHIDVQSPDRQKDRRAVQLFSDTVSKVLMHLYGYVFKHQSEIISLIDQFWDDMESRTKFYRRNINVAWVFMKAFSWKFQIRCPEHIHMLAYFKLVSEPTNRLTDIQDIQKDWLWFINIIGISLKIFRNISY